MSGQTQRVQRLNEILEILKSNNGRIKESKLYGLLALKYGLTQRTFDDYLAALKAAGKIEMPLLTKIGEDIEITLVNH
jgi:hypothetical protein